MKRLHWFIARHYLGASRGRGLLSLITWIALGGVTVGVTALIVVIAVMTGMQEDLRGKILESTPHIIVMEQSSSLRVLDWERVVESVLEVDGITGAAPFALSQVSIVRRSMSGQYSQPANLYGVAIDTTLWRRRRWSAGSSRGRSTSRHPRPVSRRVCWAGASPTACSSSRVTPSC